MLRLRKLSLLLSGIALILPSCFMLLGGVASATSYNQAELIDDYTFLHYNSMDASDIYTFLHNEGSYLSLHHTFKEICDGPYETAHYAHCGQNEYPWTLIADAATAYGINPRVIMSTMEKEESLITDSNPSQSQLDSAMGYDCPDNDGCGGESGLFAQIDYGTFQFRLNYERIIGNNTWYNSSATYACKSSTRYYSTGLYPGRGVTFYDDNGTAYASFTIANASTASLYCYTPHAYNNPDGINGLPAYGTRGQYYSGSYNFVASWQDWWGSDLENPVSITYYSNSTSESGGSAKLGFALSSQPSDGASVSIPLSISNPGEASFSPSSSVTSTTLTISNGNWRAASVNTVTVYGRDDSLHDGDVAYNVITGQPTSDDDTYGSLSASDVPDATLTNIDNEPDIPLVGDWNGNGKDTVSLRRGTLNLINESFDGHTDFAYNYGSTDYNDNTAGSNYYEVLVGDWNGDGKDTLGFKVGNLYILNYGNDGHSDFAFHYGNGSETPLVGDWNGDGKDTISLKSGHSYLINNGFDGHTDFAYNYGNGSETPLVGDWNGDKKDTVSLRVGSLNMINNGFDGHTDFAYNYGR